MKWPDDIPKPAPPPKRVTLRQQLQAENPASHRITVEELAVLQTRIEREVAISHVTRERRRAFA